jgi:hypothetical protein
VMRNDKINWIKRFRVRSSAPGDHLKLTLFYDKLKFIFLNEVCKVHTI